MEVVYHIFYKALYIPVGCFVIFSINLLVLIWCKGLSIARWAI